MAIELSGDALIGAAIALVSVTIAQFLQYYFTSRKEKERVYKESIQKVKASLLKARINLRDLYISSVKIDTYYAVPLSPEEWKDFSKNVIIGLIEVSSALHSFRKTKDIANSVDEIYDDAMNFTLFIEEKTNRFSKIIGGKNSVNGKVIYKKYSELIEKIDKILKRPID